MDNETEKLYYGSYDSDGAKLHYARTSSELPPVVFLHGITNSGMGWSKLALAISKRYDVYLPDARGHGLSEAPDGSYALPQLARDAAHLIESLAIQQPVVIGHSMGAATAGLLAAEYPGLVRALVLMDPPWIAPEIMDQMDPAQGVQEFEDKIDFYHQTSLQELMEKNRVEHPEWGEAVTLQWSKAAKQTNRKVAAGVPTFLMGWQDIAAKIQCPVLLMTGNVQKGSLVSQEISDQLLRAHPSWSAMNFPEVGHLIWSDAYAESLKGVQDFLFKQFFG